MTKSLYIRLGSRHTSFEPRYSPSERLLDTSVDRAGCQVTEPIKYSTKGNRQLTETSLRLDRLADDLEARGWDPIVKDATAKGADDFTVAVWTAREEIFGPARRRTRARREIDPKFFELVGSVGDPNKHPRRGYPFLMGK